MLEWFIQFILSLIWLILQSDSYALNASLTAWTSDEIEHIDLHITLHVVVSKTAAECLLMTHPGKFGTEHKVGVHRQMCSLRHPDFPLRPICAALLSDAMSMGVVP